MPLAFAWNGISRNHQSWPSVSYCCLSHELHNNVNATICRVSYRPKLCNSLIQILCVCGFLLLNKTIFFASKYHLYVDLFDGDKSFVWLQFGVCFSIFCWHICWSEIVISYHKFIPHCSKRIVISWPDNDLRNRFCKWTNTPHQPKWSALHKGVATLQILFEYRRLLWMIWWLFMNEFFVQSLFFPAFFMEGALIRPRIPFGHTHFYIILSNSMLVFTTSFPYLYLSAIWKCELCMQCAHCIKDEIQHVFNDLFYFRV